MKRTLLLLLAFVLLSSCHREGRVLRIYCWANAISHNAIRQFEKKTGCKVYVDTFDSNELMYAKIKAGAADYDLLLPSNYWLGILAKQDLILPIDRKRIKNWNNLDPEWLSYFEPEELAYGVPGAITLTGIGYRKDRVPDILPSWRVFGNPKYRKRMTMLNDLRETIGAALQTLDLSINTTDPKEIDRAAGLVIEWTKNLAKFEDEQYQNGIATAEFLIVQGYSSDFLQVQAENPNVAFLFPKEGGVLSFYQTAIPKSSKAVDLAYEFMDFLLEPEISMELMQHNLQFFPNRAAYPLIPEHLKNDPSFIPPEPVRKKLEVIRNIGGAITHYNAAWEKIKDS